MPFWRKDKKNSSKDEDSNGSIVDSKPKEKINYKARLEHRQYLAQESPEPVYNISECGLKNVPPGVYSKCKVLRKDALLLQNNELTLLTGGGTISDMACVLQVLNLQSNLLEKLPDEIGSLKELKVLYLHHNKLKKLPESLGQLKKLQSLNVSHNALKELPNSMGTMHHLNTLDVRSNAKLIKLPKNLCQARAIHVLEMDVTNFQYPPSNICEQGTEAIMKYLCKECDIEYISPSDYHPPNVENGKNSNGGCLNGFHEDPYEQIVKSNLKVMEKNKEDKIKEMLAMEKAREESQQKEAVLAANVQIGKKKLLTDLAAEESKREEAVKKMQQLRDKEKVALVGSLASVENNTDALISQLMASNARHSDPQRVLEELEREKKEMEDQLTIKAGEAGKLRAQEVKKEMQRLMEEEMRREQVRRQYEDGKQAVINNALTVDMENDKALDLVLSSKGKHQDDLISNLLEDEKYQREAFTALFLKQDSRHKEISSQVEQIQKELASLTMVEMTKKDLKMEFERDVMEEKRQTLSKMLMQLMDQKADRAKELQDRLKELDNTRSEDMENYWLIQYQKLLDSKPKKMVEAEAKIEPALKDLLTNANAEEYVPVLALRNITVKQLSYMKDHDLAEFGIHNSYIRQKILVMAGEYVEKQGHLAEKMSGLEDTEGGAPSAPPIGAEPSAPSKGALEEEVNGGDPEGGAKPSAPLAEPMVVDTFKSTECVICLENKCNIIFLPCGHVCCCGKCQSEVTACPLCRKTIQQKIKLA
ncbi:hypothetical protein TCAL_05773 [Tigriopus californicus]|uniref:RING-type domain-containing protein n=1 Tax=Tigriopus californicus TaxID=6832 RepID=A0A553ND16_TIGCA|nr:E3 ubiquitin-protein ligase LRSAM1-like [Tigriopus californicus]TRY63249.1 hypothetical protein TCAL_05773 [Tigriopus californicus]